MTQYTVKITRFTKDTQLPADVKAGGVRFQLVNPVDNSVVASYDDSAAGVSHEFTGINDESLIPNIQDLDSTGAVLGAAVVGDAFTPSALIAATTPATYAATASITVSAVAEAAAA